MMINTCSGSNIQQSVQPSVLWDHRSGSVPGDCLLYFYSCFFMKKFLPFPRLNLVGKHCTIF